MVEYRTETLSRTFSALSAPMRLAILDQLTGGSRTVLELAEPFDVSLNAVSKHVKVLEGAGLVSRDVRGREHHISLAAEPFRDVADYAEYFRRFWEDRLDALEGYLERRRRGQTISSQPNSDGSIPHNREEDDDAD